MPGRAPVKRPRLNLITPHMDNIPSRKPPPVRRWDEIARIGKPVDEDLIRSMRPDDLHRDIYTEEDRLKAWQRVEHNHHLAREQNPGYPEKHGLFLFSAGMGEGKSLLMCALALAAYVFRAVPVFSPDSAGLLFGNRIDLASLYQFSDVVPQGSVLVADEIAALADNYGGQATRSRTLGATMTSFRKGASLVLAGTAAEWSIAGQLRVTAEAVVTPRRYRPTKQVLTDFDSRKRPIYTTMTLRDNELKCPSFAYMKATALGIPWERRRVQEDYEKQLRDAQRAKRKSRNDALEDLARWRPMGFSVPPPWFMAFAAKLYDTHSRVPVSDQHAVSADVMRQEAEARQDLRDGPTQGDVAERLGALLRWSVGTRLYDEHWGSGYIPFKDLHRGAVHFDRRTFGRMSVAAFRRHYQRVVPDGYTARRAKIEAIMDYCRSR